MVGWGLIGAAQGLGKGLASVGEDLEKRRAAAIEYAKKEAIEEARLAQQAQLAAQRESGLDARAVFSAESAMARTQEAQAGQDRRTGMQITSQDKRTRMQIEAQQDLARLRGRIQRDNSTAAIRLRENLASDDVHGVTWIKHDPKDDTYEVATVRENGTIVGTGVRSKRWKDVPVSSTRKEIDYGNPNVATVTLDDEDEDE